MFTILIISAPVLGLGFGIFILTRLRIEPAMDPEDEVRRQRIEDGLGLGQPPNQRSLFLPAAHNPALQGLLPQRMDELKGYSLR